jgi:hypothetical protein
MFDEFNAFAWVLGGDGPYGPSLGSLVRSCVETLGRAWWLMDVANSSVLAHRAAVLPVDEARYLARNDGVAATRGDDGEIRTLRGNEIEQAARERLARVRVEGESASAPGYRECPGLPRARDGPPHCGEQRQSRALLLADVGRCSRREDDVGIVRRRTTRSERYSPNRPRPPGRARRAIHLDLAACNRPRHGHYSRCGVAVVRSCIAHGPERFTPASRLSSRHSEVANDRVGDTRDFRAVFAHVVGGPEGP